MTDDCRAGWRLEWLAPTAIVATFVVGWLLVGPRADVPVIDDWVYAWSVEHLLKTGRLQVLEFSAIYPLAQVLWGALFAWAAGFSFGVLRLSTVVLSALGCWAVYLTLGELGCRRSTSLLGAFALALDPAYFALSFSFMTEVPFISLATIATYFYVSAVGRGRVAGLWVGGTCSIAAFLVRPVGVVLPLGAVPALLWRHDWRSASRRAAVPLATTLVAMGVLRAAIGRALGPLDWLAIREEQLRWWFLVPIGKYLTWNIRVAFESAFPLAPVLVASMVRWRRAMLVGAVALALVVPLRLIVGGVPTPLPDWQTWSLQDIGARAMIGGSLGPSPWSLRVAPAVRLIGLLTVASLLVTCAKGGLGTVTSHKSPITSPAVVSHKSSVTSPPLHQSPVALRWGRAEGVVVTIGLLQLAMIHLLWLYNDRYYLVLAPTLAIVGARAIDADRRAKWVASALLVVWAAVATSGTRDMLAFNEACASAARQLEAAGIPASEIDAGYTLNGWRLYAHPENLPPGADRKVDVPFVTSETVPRFRIVNRPLPEYDVVRVVPLERATWQATRAVYVLRHR